MGKPPLSDFDLEQIAVKQYSIHQQFVSDIPQQGVGIMSAGNVMSGMLTGIRPPRQPIKISRILSGYAIKLFDAEASYYPLHHAELTMWLEDLEKRIENMVIDHVGKISSIVGLRYHVTESEIRTAVSDGVRNWRPRADQPKAIYGPASAPLAIVAEKPDMPFVVPPIGTVHKPKVSSSLGERLDAAAIDIGHDEQAHRIGISRSMYFKVKSGRGGKKSTMKAEIYLSKLDGSSKANLD